MSSASNPTPPGCRPWLAPVPAGLDRPHSGLPPVPVVAAPKIQRSGATESPKGTHMTQIGIVLYPGFTALDFVGLARCCAGYPTPRSDFCGTSPARSRPTWCADRRRHPFV